MIVRTIHRAESAFRFYLEDTLARFEYHLKHGVFPDDDERDEERLELYEKLAEEQRLEVWGLSADLYSLLDKEQPPSQETTLDQKAIAARLQAAYGSSNWKELLRLLRFQNGLMHRSVVDYMRCRAWDQLGHPEVAIFFIQNAIRLDPKDSGYKHLALELLKRMKDWDSLTEFAEQYASECFDDAGVLLAVGESYHDLAIHSRQPFQDEKAVEYLKRGLDLTAQQGTRNSQSASAVVTLAFALLNLERSDEAISVLDVWLSTHSHDGQIYAARGLVHLTSNYDLAIQDFRRAVKNRTKVVLPYVEYANWLLHQREYENAISVATSGLSVAVRSSDEAKLLHLIGLGSAMLGRLDKASQLLHQAKQADPTDQTLSANLLTIEQSVKRDDGVVPNLTLPPQQTRDANELLRQLAA